MVIHRRFSRCGLQLLDDRFRSGISDALYLSLVSGMFLFVVPIENDGKLNLSWGFNSLDGVGQLPSDVVEAGAEVVDNFTGSDAESKGNRDFLGSFLHAVPGITLLFSDDVLPIF